MPGGSPTGSVASDASGLRREVSLPLLVLYGLGTTVGAGIYALMGEVSGSAGMRAPLAFVVSALLAGTTAIGFAELAGRLPKAAGEAVFVDHAFGRRALTATVGGGVLIAGVVAAAAVTDAFAGYVAELTDAPKWLLSVGLIVGLTALSVIGAKESVTAAAAFTIVEIGGLLLVLWAGRDSFGEVISRADELVGPPTSLHGWSGVLGGAFLAFFAFLGFEDIDSVAEEADDARVNLPRAVLITLGVTTLLYVTVAAISVLQVSPERLRESDAPLALIYGEAGGSRDVMAFIAALAMVNGALVQMVMVPRVVYGLSNLGLAPRAIGAVSPRTHTPVRATLVAAAAVTALTLSLDIGWLARLTSAVTMAVFVSVNASLIRIKREDGPTSSFSVPGWVPVVGITASAGMFVAEIWRLVG